jgi:hypothetical protein
MTAESQNCEASGDSRCYATCVRHNRGIVGSGVFYTVRADSYVMQYNCWDRCLLRSCASTPPYLFMALSLINLLKPAYVP